LDEGLTGAEADSSIQAQQYDPIFAAKVNSAAMPPEHERAREEAQLWIDTMRMFKSKLNQLQATVGRDLRSSPSGSDVTPISGPVPVRSWREGCHALHLGWEGFQGVPPGEPNRLYVFVLILWPISPRFLASCGTIRRVQYLGISSLSLPFEGLQQLVFQG